MIKSILRKKRVIFITGSQRQKAGYFIDFILQSHLSVLRLNHIPSLLNFFSVLKSEIIIIEDNKNESSEKIRNFLSSLPICVFVVTQARTKVRVNELLRGFAKEWRLIIDFSTARKIKKDKNKNTLTFGIDKKKADIYITDIYQKEEETNFKVNYDYKIIPFWLNKKLKKKEIYAILPALCLAKLFKLNMAEVSFKIKKDLGFM